MHPIFSSAKFRSPILLNWGLVSFSCIFSWPFAPRIFSMLYGLACVRLCILAYWLFLAQLTESDNFARVLNVILMVVCFLQIVTISFEQLSLWIFREVRDTNPSFGVKMKKTKRLFTSTFNLVQVIFWAFTSYFTLHLWIT